MIKQVWLSDTLDDALNDCLADDAIKKCLSNCLGQPRLGVWQLNFTLRPLETKDMWILNCRCGMEGDGCALSDGQDVIQCDICKAWSHLTCHRRRKALSLRKSQKFRCNACLPPSVLPLQTHKILYVLSTTSCHMPSTHVFREWKKKVVMQKKPSGPPAKRLQ